MAGENQNSSHKKLRSAYARKLLVLTGALALIGLLFWQLHDTISIDYLANREIQLREWQSQAPLLVAMIALGGYVVVAGLSLPGAAVLSMFCGWYFGFWKALFVVSFGSTGGAMVAFFISRYVLRDWFQSRLHERLSRLNAAFAREGAYYLFTLRLIPAIPFFVINVVMGLTQVRALTFWWVSQLGMLPGTAAYVYAGSTLPSLQTLAQDGVKNVLSWEMLVAFALIGLLPLAAKKYLPLLKKNNELPEAT